MSDPAVARVLRCPVCGGPVQEAARQCAHCAAELLTVRCGTCFTLVVVGSAHCSACGKALELEGRIDLEGLSCPRCGESAKLSGLDVGSHQVAECRRCTGIFVSHEVLASITARTEREAGVRFQVRPNVQRLDAVTYLPCPACRTVMTRRSFARGAGIITDICTDHGVWFDAGELTAALAFIDSGGLDRARQKDMADLREADRQARVSASTAAAKSPRNLSTRDMWSGDQTSAIEWVLRLFW